MKFSKNYPTFQAQPLDTCNSGPSLKKIWFARQELGMKWYGSTKDHRAAPHQAKGLGASQVLPGGNSAVVIPTQKLLDTNLATPESFTPIGRPIQKLVNIIQSTKTSNHKHTAPFIQTPVAQINKQKCICLLKFHFRWGLFYTKLQNSAKKIPPPPPGPPFNSRNPLPCTDAGSIFSTSYKTSWASVRMK